MSHKHHSCSCPHEQVEYCKTCRVVHCKDCNQEWVTKTVNYWQYTPTYYGNSEPTITFGNVNLTKCEHGS